MFFVTWIWVFSETVLNDLRTMASLKHFEKNSAFMKQILIVPVIWKCRAQIMLFTVHYLNRLALRCRTLFSWIVKYPICCFEWFFIVLVSNEVNWWKPNIIRSSLYSRIIFKNSFYDALRDLIPFVEFEKCEKDPRRSVLFSVHWAAKN